MIMESYFTVLSASIRPEIDEKVTLALLLTKGSKVHFAYSKEKLGIAKQLLPAMAYRYLRDVLKSIGAEVIEQNAKDVSLFGSDEMALLNPAFDFKYISYLTKYSNAVLHFSEPKRIDGEVTSTLLEALFKKYISDTVAKATPSNTDRLENLMTKIYERVRGQYNIEREFTSREIPNLAVPLKIDLIGKNEAVVYAQTIDLERPLYNIQNDIGLVATLNEAYQHQAKSFIVSAEPDKALFPKQHQAWESIRHNSLAEYVDASEVEKLKVYADKHKVKPLIAEEAQN
jgi:hypothetical protein